MSGKEEKPILEKDEPSADATPVTTDTSIANETNALSRKRTRDDVEQEEEEEATEEIVHEDRPVAQLKRQRSVAELKSDEKKESVDKEPLEEVDELKEADEPSKDESESIVETKDSFKEETKEESKKESKSETKEEESKPEIKETIEKPSETPVKPKFVFGSTTPFGVNAFSIIGKKKNVFETEKSTTSSTESKPVASVFGSNSKFGNAFQSAIGKTSIFDKKEEVAESKEENDNTDSSKQDNNGSSTSNTTATTTTTTNTHLYKQVELEKKDIKSGEEDELQVFSCKAKLYALDLTNVKEGWKERGVGTIHVNKSQQVGKSSRVIMRSNGLLKVILNSPLVQGTTVIKGMPSSLSSEKFIRFTSFEDGKPIQYALKTGNVELTTSLFEEIEKLIPQTV